MRTIKADMHLHSKYSKRPSEWILRKIGCAESYSEPLELYNLAKTRGMDLVTISDHNTIDGALEIAHLPQTFVSEEATSYFPEDGCKAHVLVYDINERQHEEISRARQNIYDLVEYLNAENIVNAIAHPLFPINHKLTVEHVEKFFLLFKIMEANGARDSLQNDWLKNHISRLTEEDLERLADKHDMAPVGSRPWEKIMISGSDDHSSLTMASSFTIADSVSDDKDSFLAAVKSGRCEPGGSASDPKTLALNIYSIAYQFYQSKFQFEQFMGETLLKKFFGRVMAPDNWEEEEEYIVDRIKHLLGRSIKRRIFKSRPKSLPELIRTEARNIILSEASMSRLVKDPSPSISDRPATWFNFVNKVSEKVLKTAADKALDQLATGNFFDLFHMIGSAGSLYTGVAPYLISYSVFSQGRNVVRDCNRHFSPEAETSKKPYVNMAHFTDTFHEINGVALTLNMQKRTARKNGIPLTMITCGPDDAEPGVKHFKPVGEFELPEYSDIKLYYPPILEMLDYCYEKGFTHIHSATPGPIGLAALAISKVLQIPIYGTYHTALPQYASQLTGDSAMEDAAWKFIVWYYEQMDRIYTPSRATGAELASKGISKNKIKFYERGIDVQRFNPGNRNGFYKSGYDLGDDLVKLLYVGRVSKEKNLPFLAQSFKEMSALNKNMHLVIIGDGPYLEEMKQSLKGYPATFTGFLTGTELEQAYASADIFVFPSMTDTFGNTILEAQASGIPVVVSDEGGPQENCVQGKTGFIVPSSDPQAWKDVILNLAQDRDKRIQMGLDARDFMQSHSFESKYMELWESYGGLS